MSQVFRLLAASALLAALPSIATASSEPDSHAPIGVMADHTHKQGEWMLSYRYMDMRMDGNRDGSNDLSTDAVLAQGYMMAPQHMNTRMHMFGAMYAPNNRWTLMFMLPYLDKSMAMVNKAGLHFNTHRQGVGDFKVSGMRVLIDGIDHLQLNVGVSLPTGDTGSHDTMPGMMGPVDAQLPYPMQNGSGTWDFLAGLSWRHELDSGSYGAQVNTVLRSNVHAGNTNRHYRLGNRAELTGWRAWRVGEHISLSLRLAAQTWGNIHGADPALNPAMTPTADPELRAGRRLLAGAGINFLTRGGHHLGLEWTQPLYQKLDGPQLKSDNMLTLGWQYAF